MGSLCSKLKSNDEQTKERPNPKLTLEMMIPAMLMRTLGPLSSLYRRSTPFQNEMKYFLISALSPLCNLTRQPFTHTFMRPLQKIGLSLASSFSNTEWLLHE